MEWSSFSCQSTNQSINQSLMSIGNVSDPIWRLKQSSEWILLTSMETPREEEFLSFVFTAIFLVPRTWLAHGKTWSLNSGGMNIGQWKDIIYLLSRVQKCVYFYVNSKPNKDICYLDVLYKNFQLKFNFTAIFSNNIIIKFFLCWYLIHVIIYINPSPSKPLLTVWLLYYIKCGIKIIESVFLVLNHR